MTAGMHTLGRLAQLVGLTRSSLLHYEQLGLLAPAARSPTGYRLYGEPEMERLRAIRRYREAGLSLAEVGHLLGTESIRQAQVGDGPAQLLESRLIDLCNQTRRLRAQQMKLATLLASAESGRELKSAGKSAWVALLRRAGFSEQDMRQWHADFEAESPSKHAEFLRALGLPSRQVAAIRRWARELNAPLARS